jgi:hypothetical protein
MRSRFIPVIAATGDLETVDREPIAAILTAGMLPTLPIPQSRSESVTAPVTDAEGEAIQRSVGHAIGLNRSVLEGRGVDPFAGLPGHNTSRQQSLAPPDRVSSLTEFAGIKHPLGKLLQGADPRGISTLRRA